MYMIEICRMKNSLDNLNKEVYTAIGIRLKELRKIKGYKNYEHVAYELEMSRSGYWNLEKGANFEMKTLIRICYLFEITLEEFFQGIELPKGKTNTKK